MNKLSNPSTHFEPELPRFGVDVLRAAEMNEMLERNPSWLIQWGILSIVLVLGILITIASVVHYPDTLEGSAILTSDPLPIRVKAGVSGRIVSLLTPDNGTVRNGEPIAELQNTTGYKNIQYLEAISSQAQLAIENNNFDKLRVLLISPLSALGETQLLYNKVVQSASEYLEFKKVKMYDTREANLEQQIDRHKQIANITREETELTKQELKQTEEEFNANEKLYVDKVISKKEYFEEVAKLRQKEMILKGQNKNEVQQSITAGDNKKQLLELEYERSEKERTLRLAFEESIRNLQSYIESWKLQYLMVAPLGGKVHFVRPIQANEHVAAGEELFAVMPDSFHYVAQVQLSPEGLGKIKVGQSAHLLLSQFPYNEFGYLEGRVLNISTILQKLPDASGKEGEFYLVNVRLPDKLITSFKKEIPFTPEMVAKARIITKDQSLLSRLINSIAKVEK